MSDLRAAIDTLKAALDKTPRDSTTRPVHTALLDVLTLLADKVETPPAWFDSLRPLENVTIAGTYLLTHDDEDHPMPEPKRKGWPKGKPRKPQPEPVNG